MAQLIHPNGQVERLAPAKRKFSLDELQKAVGGYIEMLDVWVTRSKAHDPFRLSGRGDRVRLRLVLNEEGKLRGLPYNPAATALLGHYAISDHLVGSVVVVETGDKL